MRYRDQPSIEVTQRVHCDVPTAWAYVTDITVPARCSAELQSVEWLDGADHVEVGARFRGRNTNEAIGTWETVCHVVEVDDQRRWVWDVQGHDGPIASWGFEVEPARDGVLMGRSRDVPGVSVNDLTDPELLDVSGNAALKFRKVLSK